MGDSSQSAQAWAELMRGCVEVLPEDDLKQRLQAGKPLRVKLGFDPTAADIHLGHVVILQKLRQFQDLGHHILFLVGDFTARVGDPTGKNVMRQPLSDEQIQANATTYEAQVFKVLDPKRTEVVFNSSWMKAQSAADMVRLASLQTVARMLERDDFAKRYRDGKPIAIHEFLYPLLQGYDSVALQADIELGGLDQKFNLLMGRELQRHFGQTPQVVMMMPLLEGLDGVKKMSKSLGNYIGITDSATDMLGKVMSISDDLMWRYLELLSSASLDAIEQKRQAVASGENPRHIKMALAKELVTRFHSSGAAEDAEREFDARFKRGQLPGDLPLQRLAVDAAGIEIARALQALGLVSSASEGMRMIKQGAVKLDGNKLEDVKLRLQISDQELVLQVGKRRVAKVILYKA